MATANQRVGSIYEVGIEGVGYMLSDNPSRPVRRQTGVLETQPPGSDDPLSERIGRYDFIAQTDWTGGEGQEMADRPASDVTRYFYSEWLDPLSTPGQVTCLQATEQVVADTYDLDPSPGVTEPGLIGSGGTAYLQTDDTELTDQDGTAFDTGLGALLVIRGLAFDGKHWYASDASTIRRNNASADPGSDWSTKTNVYEIAWCVDRLMGLRTPGVSPAEVYSFDPAGTATTIPGVHPASDVNLTGLTSGDGYAWYGVTSVVDYRSRVYFWQVDSDPTNAGIAVILPEDEMILSLYYYLGNIFVSTGEIRHDDTLGPVNTLMKIYRCVHNGDGTLIPQLVVEASKTDGSNSAVQRSWFAGSGKYVAFDWDFMTSDIEPGLGVIDLETGGVVRWGAATGASGVPQGVIPYDGGFAFRVDQATGTEGGMWLVRHRLYPHTPAYRAGYLETSTSDLGTPALKHLDAIEISTLPLPDDGGVGDPASVKVEYSIDGGATYTTAATFDTAGDTGHSVEFTTAIVSSSFRLRATLTPTTDGTGAPTITALLAKTHATGITDEIIELPVNCEDYIADVHDTRIAEDSGPNKGVERYRALRDLIGTKVLFQDIDWKETSTTSLPEVVGVESTSVHVFNQNRNLSDVSSHVAVVTLRRPVEFTG